VAAGSDRALLLSCKQHAMDSENNLDNFVIPMVGSMQYQLLVKYQLVSILPDILEFVEDCFIIV
jgi:hypothetical protein